MRLKRMIGNSLWAAVLALVIPVSQAQAQECVQYNGLNHCSKGGAKVTEGGDKGVQVETDGSGKGGVIIHTGLATNWTAATFEANDDGKTDGRTFLSSVSEGSTTSTATIETSGEKTAYSSTFTSAGEDTTHSVALYYRGVLQYAVGGVRQGPIVITEPVGPVGPVVPYCRPRYQTYSQCMSSCSVSPWYPNCGYCARPCQNTFTTTPRGACEWRFELAHANVRINDRVVRADEVVFSEEVRGPSSYPYLGFDQIHIETTARDMTVTNESVVNACTIAK